MVGHCDVRQLGCRRGANPPFTTICKRVLRPMPGVRSCHKILCLQQDQKDVASDSLIAVRLYPERRCMGSHPLSQLRYNARV